MKTSFSFVVATVFVLATLVVSDSSNSVAQAPEDAAVAAPAVQAEVDVQLAGLDEPYAVGDLIEIDAVVNGVDDPKRVTYDWKILPEVEIKKWPDGSKILLGTGPAPTEYTIFLAVGVVSDGAQPSQQLFTRIGTVVVKQEVESSPPPAGAPPVELGELGKEAVRLTELVRVNEFYTQDDLKKDARALADNFNRIAAQVRSGEITSLEEALNKTREFNRSFPSRDNWAEWFSGLSAKLSTANDDGQLSTTDQIVTVWSDVANGLSSL